MYILLIVVHAIFLFITHLLGYFLLEWVFLVLLLFFLLYFSPIFFFKKSNTNFSELLTFDISPQNSLIIPIILTYLGIYILAFTFSGSIAASIHIHIAILLALYAIGLGYIFGFQWKNDIFFDILWFHLLFSYVTIIATSLFYWFFRESIIWIDVVFSLVTLAFSYLYYTYKANPKREFYFGFLVSIFSSFFIGIWFLFPQIWISHLFGTIAIVSIVLFEVSEKHDFFKKFRVMSRIFFLIVSIVAALILLGNLFFEFSSIYYLFLLVIFFLSTHIRFSNIITFVGALSILFILYSYLFVSLIRADSLFSSLLFIYFLPAILIVQSYFWNERQKYDFIIIHYMSIGFSVLFFLYSILLAWWNQNNTIFISLSVFLLAALMFLSYFRFRIKQ